ncbi:MAG: cadherin-like domain-containing protein [Leptolyngbyaceae cyanobacterium SL_5_14]|nr:cadherin-like domain-containing protein [Leptolyngbyaceae cyanobacterium SL_5_14]
MAAFIVTNTSDSGEGSLRAAVFAANANPGEDAILFSGSVFFDATPDTITLTSGQLTFTDSARTVLSGQGADRLTISGNNTSRVFEVASGATAFLSSVAIANGLSVTGGGILNAGVLTLSSSQLTNNSASFGGGVFNNAGTLVIDDSTLNGNSATAAGGGISNFAGTLDISNSTLSGNSAVLWGGGIETLGDTPVTIRNSTLTLNQENGLYIVDSPVLVQNTIIAENTGANVSGTLSSGSAFNLIGGDPKLAPLANNGGTTLTHALLSDSPARNTGSNALISPGVSRDQRGSRFSRIISEVVDIGAFEALPVVSLTPVLNNQEEGTGETTGFVYNLFLSARTDVPVTVTLGITGGTATTDDFAVVPTVFSLSPGSLGAALMIEVNGDSTFEPDETFTYSILSVTNATINPNASSMVSTIVNDDLLVNRNPVAVNDSATVASYQSVNINVLTNDTDLDGDPLTLSVLNSPSNGTAIANSNGTPTNLTDDFITYTPTPGYCGPDSFTYQIEDGKGGTAIATVNVTVTGANLTGTPENDNDISNPALVGTHCVDTIDGKAGSDRITGKPGNDTLTGGGGQDQFIYSRGDGRDLITDFGGVGRLDNPSAAIRAEVDIVQFQGAGLTARNLILTQVAANLEITFEGVADAKVTLQNFQLGNLDNLRRGNSTTAGLGNLLFNGQTSIQNDFDVFEANSTRSSVLARNTVTFLNNRNNVVSGFNNSDDVINGQGGNDRLEGRNGNDLLRGGSGNDTLLGGAGNDRLVGGSGADQVMFGANNTFRPRDFGVDSIADFSSAEGDKIGLSRSSFQALTSAAGASLNSNDFRSINASTNDAAATLAAKIVYNRGTGDLIYNENGAGSGLGSGGRFAILTTRPTLGASNFLIQSS